MGEVQPPAGWYPDPSGRVGNRYWTGTAWHELPPDHKMSRAAKIVLSLSAVGLVICAVLAFATSAGNVSTDFTADVIETCQGAVKKGLKDPDSARFDSWAATSQPSGAAEGEKRYTASGFVNAKNGFGGYTGNKTYSCAATVTREGDVSATAGPV